MGMTVAQAKQVVAAQNKPDDDPLGGLGDDGSDTGVDPAIYDRYLSGNATDEDLQTLVAIAAITLAQSYAYATARDTRAKPSTPLNTTGGLYPYDPGSGQYSPYPAESPIGGPAEYGNGPLAGPINTLVDPSTGVLYNAKGVALPQYLQKALGGIGGAGSDHYATDKTTAYNYAQLAQRAKEFEQTYGQQQQSNEQSFLSNRATAGNNLGTLVQGLGNDAYQRALDPGNYPAYLAASAGLPQGSGSPISALIGQGAQIQPPEGSNPLADPRFQSLIGNLYEYAQPGALQTVQGIAGANGGQLPQEFYDYTHTQNPNVHAQGGTQMLSGPTVGIPANQLEQGQTPEFLAGEAGPERIDFSPMHAHDKEAGIPVPHQHEGAHAEHEHVGPMIRYADGGSAITGVGPTAHQLNASWNAYHPNEQKADNVFTPAEGTAMSLGKALQPLGYVPSYLTGQLMEGRTPTPGSIDEATLMRLPPSLRALLQAQIRSALGSAGVMDFNAQLQQNALPGLNNGGITSTVYSA